MAPIFILSVLFLALFLPLLYFLTKSRSTTPRLPPGSLGMPVIGQSLSFLRALRTNTAEEWLAQRINKYGPVSKLSLFGTPTIFLAGPAANKLVFSSEALAPQQPKSTVMIFGERNILEMVGDDHRRVRGAVAQFLRPEMLKPYVSKVDEDVMHHLEMYWIGRENVTVLPLMKRLTFDVINSLMFGLEQGAVREGLVHNFADMMIGIWAIPVNLPFTHFNRGVRAGQRVRKVLREIIKEKRAAEELGQSPSHKDLITYLLSMGNNDQDGKGALTEEEIVDNAILTMMAGHETTSVLITFMIRHLSQDPETYASIAHEQEEIARSKALGEALTWDDLMKMKYTWRVAMETMRMIPPLIGNFRKVLKDVEFNGYLIPKGWQVFWASSSTQMDANIFQEPWKFDPTRFENQSAIPPYCFVAFGAGPRVCPGSELAKIETLILMHRLVTQFKWKLCGKDDSYCRNPVLLPSQGLPIQLEPKIDLSETSS